MKLFVSSILTIFYDFIFQLLRRDFYCSVKSLDYPHLVQSQTKTYFETM